MKLNRARARTSYTDLCWADILNSVLGRQWMSELLRADPDLAIVLHMLGLTPSPRMRRWSFRNYGAFHPGDERVVRLEKKGYLKFNGTTSFSEYHYYSVTDKGAEWAGVAFRVRNEDRVS